MSPPRYSYDSDPGEHTPLDGPNDPYNRSHSQYRQQSSPPRQQQHSRHHNDQPYYQDQSPERSPRRRQEASSRYESPSRTAAALQPGAHPDSAFARNRAKRNSGAYRSAAAAGVGAGAVAGGTYAAAEAFSSAPPPPPHRQGSGADQSWANVQSTNTTTPGADNFSEAAAGGLAGIASSVAEQNARQSGLHAMRGIPQQQPYSPYDQQAPSQTEPSPYRSPPPTYGQPEFSQQNAYGQGYDSPASIRPGLPQDGLDRNSHSSLTPLGAAAFPPGRGTPSQAGSGSHSPAYANSYYDDPTFSYGQRLDPRLSEFNPNDIDDDGDDGLNYRRPSARNSFLSLGNSSERGHNAAGAAGGAAAAGAAAGFFGKSNRNSGANYGPVGANGSTYDLGKGAEKSSEWLSKRNRRNKKWKWAIMAVIALLIIGAIVGAVLGTLLKNGGSKNSEESASDDTAENGDLNSDSAEIQALMNNPDLHKVFPGIDYTPLNTQFPDCLENPPSQNNVTRDVAVLSQMTNTIRLYGTDCNQTEMTIHALSQLKLNDTIKIWLGVWQDNNDTTNARQLSQMWNILDTYGDTPFKGLIVANEILFREQMTTSQLGDLLASVRNNLTTKGLSLPVATSDLGDKWTAELADVSDYVMANIHPFFGGVNAKDAASWTYSFWENNNGAYFKSDTSKNIISETGWPSQGGTDCGTTAITDCPDAAVAGITELNQFMEDWVCQALTNGTNYFWFESFDEPWKISYNSGNENWEDHWGLMTVDRTLKSGVKIPDCGGQTVGAA